MDTHTPVEAEANPEGVTALLSDASLEGNFQDISAENVEPIEDLAPDEEAAKKEKTKTETLPSKLQMLEYIGLDNWYTDHSQLVYISECNQNKTVPSGYFLRNIDKDVLAMRHCVLGPQRIRPICVSLCNNITITKLDLTDAWICDEVGCC